MTSRERFLAVLNFQRPADHLPTVEWAAWWDVTVARWQAEGLSPALGWEELQRYFGLEVLCCFGAWTRGPGCPTASHHGAGIMSDTASYEALLPYLYSEQGIAAAVDQAHKLKERHDRGEIAVRIWLDGFFWFPRGLWGIEPHLYAFYDEPELMHRVNADLLAYHLRTLDAVLPVLAPEFVGIAEDMSYNNGPMLSHELFEEFLAPYYRQLVPAIKRRGVKVLVDTDGQLESMIPWLEGVGIEGIYPLERQSGVDVARIRRDHPRFFMMGGYDKMVMARDEAAMRAEFERLLPVMRSGGYIPSVDHQTPPGVSLANYRIYIRLLHEYAARAVT